MTDQPLHILITGSLPPPLGGVTITLESLVREIENTPSVQGHVINASGIRGGGLSGVPHLLKTIWQVWIQSRRCDVVTVHVATSGVPSWGLLVVLLARLARKPVILRKFAGTDYKDLGPVHYWASMIAIRLANLFLTETQHVVALAAARGVSHVRWFPTHRSMEQVSSLYQGEPCRRFVFVGQIRDSKGIREILEAAERMPPDTVVDLYGPFFDNLSERNFAGLARVQYKGILRPGEVMDVLSRYHVSLLPSKAVTEGYPGAIIEAYRSSLPVITTQVGAITEIVDETSGIFVTPGDVDSLYQAMMSLYSNLDLYQGLREGVARRREDFSTENWCREFIQYCREVVQNEI